MTNEKIQQAFEQYIENPNNETKNGVILSAIPTVNQVVSRFREGKVIEKSDLFQEGVLGVYSAIEKSSSPEEFQRKLYSIIKSFVLKYHSKQDHLSTNQYSREKLGKINKFIDKYTEENLAPPSNKEISEAVGIKVKNLSQFLNANGCVADIENVPHEENLQEEFEKNEVIKRMFLAIEDKLTPLERTIVMQRYGIDSPSKTLESIGHSLKPNLCKQRVDQIHRATLSKLRILLKSDY